MSADFLIVDSQAMIFLCGMIKLFIALLSVCIMKFTDFIVKMALNFKVVL